MLTRISRHVFRLAAPVFAVIAALAVALLLLPAEPAQAATFTVTKTADTNDGACNADCSLREAIIAANALAGADVITLPGGTYTLSIAGAGEDAAATGDLDITGDLIINGAGETASIIDGGALDRVIHVVSGTVALSDLTVRNGTTVRNSRADSTGGGIRSLGSLALTNVIVSGNVVRSRWDAALGGGIYNGGGTLTLTGSTVSGNSAFSGGGIYSDAGTATLVASMVSANNAAPGGGIYNGGTLTLTGSTVNDNVGFAGGGIYNGGGTVVVTDSAITGNSANNDWRGGGVYSESGRLTLLRSTVSGNSAAGIAGGGGIHNGGTLTLTESTISGNSAGWGGGIDTLGATTLTNSTVSGNVARDGRGGGIAAGSSLTLVNATVTGNTARTEGGGLWVLATRAGPRPMTNSIVAGNSGGDCNITIPSLGYSLDSDGTCGLTGTGDLSGVNPLLGPLADNGGPTFTHALFAGSPAIDAVPVADCSLSTDQRGVSRPQGAACDIGAYEAPAPPPVTAELIPVAEDDDEGLFTVSFSCVDASDPNPTVTALLNGIAVSDGQIVELELDDEFEMEWDDGVLEMEAPAFELVATCENASGAVAAAAATPLFGAGDDDGDDEDDGEDDD